MRDAGKPLAIDLFCGLGGWTDGLLAEGWQVVGIDIEEHVYGEHRYPAGLILQDVLTVCGSAFSEAHLIVASPPCQEYSYMAMPWSKAKAKAAAIRGDATGAELERLNRLFNACFRIQCEACEAANRHIPMVVENVRGAIPWVGRSRYNFGSFHLWGDIPALMPATLGREVLKRGVAHRPDGVSNFHGHKALDERRREAMGIKNGGDWFGSGDDCSLQRRFSGSTGIKQPGIGGVRDNGKGDAWFQNGAAKLGSKTLGRKFASAMIAKIPEPLSRHIGRTYYPRPI